MRYQFTPGRSAPTTIVAGGQRVSLFPGFGELDDDVFQAIKNESVIQDMVSSGVFQVVTPPVEAAPTEPPVETPPTETPPAKSTKK